MRMLRCVASITGRFPFLTSAFLVFVSLFSFLEGAKGDEFKLIPSLSTKEEYNDNIFFTEEDRTKGFVTTLSPGLELIDRTEKLDLNLSARVNVLRYWRNGDLDRVNQFYRGRIGYSLHPKLKLSANAAYTRDFTPDRDLEVTGLILGNVRRDKQNYGAGAEYTFSEKTMGSLSYSYERSDYKDPEFTDIRSHDISLGFTHDLSKYFAATYGRMNFGYGRYEFSDSTIDYYYSTIGMSRALSEKWSILIDAGVSYVRSEFEVERLEFFRIVRDKETDKGVGWVGQGTLSYKGEKTTGDLTFNHRMMPASGTVGVTERTTLTLNIRHRFTYELSGGFLAGYYLNKADQGEFGTAATNRETLRISPRIRYEFTKDIALEGSYSFDYIKDKEADTKAQRNLFMINFIIQYPLFE